MWPLDTGAWALEVSWYSTTSSKPVPIAKVDATVETKIAEHLSVEGLPTLKFFLNEEFINFNGERTEKDNVGSIKKHVR
jgi:hypothetical protein